MHYDLKCSIRKILLELGAPVSSKGFNYTVEILCDAIVSKKAIVSGSKMCAHWAQDFEDKPTRIERSLRFVKNECLKKKSSRFLEVFSDVLFEDRLGLYDFLEVLRFYIEDNLRGEKK